MDSYKDAVALAAHYIALGITEITLKQGVERPWHLVNGFIPPADLWGRPAVLCNLEFFAYDPISTLHFSWFEDLEDEDEELDLDLCDQIVKDLPPTACALFKVHLKIAIGIIYDEGAALLKQGQKYQADAVNLSPYV